MDAHNHTGEKRTAAFGGEPREASAGGQQLSEGAEHPSPATHPLSKGKLREHVSYEDSLAVSFPSCSLFDGITVLLSLQFCITVGGGVLGCREGVLGKLMCQSLTRPRSHTPAGTILVIFVI